MPPSLPIYQQIRNKILDWIVSKEYGLGDQIPSETELAKYFNVTRMTVRQAIALLIQEGLLSRKRGAGTFVTNDPGLISRFSLDFTGFMDELFYQVSKSKTLSANVEVIKTPNIVKEKLRTEEDEVVKIERVRTFNGQIFAYTVTYLPKKIGQQITESVLYEKALLKILEIDLGIDFDEAFQTIQASFSDQYVSEKLETPSGSPILFVERIMYDKSKKPFELVQTSYRGDLYKCVVRLKLDNVAKHKRWVLHPAQILSTDKHHSKGAPRQGRLPRHLILSGGKGLDKGREVVEAQPGTSCVSVERSGPRPSLRRWRRGELDA